MGELHQHPDGRVYVRTAAGVYADSRENFAADFGRDLPPLPDGADDRIYTQGRRHAIMGKGDLIEGGPMPWPLGDEIIETVGNLLDAQNVRHTPPPPTESQLMDAVRTGAVRRLFESDLVALRFVKAGMPYPQAWRDYDAALREIARDPTAVTVESYEWPASPEKPAEI